MNANELRNIALAAIEHANNPEEVDSIVTDVIARAEKAANAGKFSVSVMWVVISPYESAVIKRLNALGFITENSGHEFILRW